MTKTCILCEENYDEELDLGSLDCKVHPRPYNINDTGEKYQRGHYDCCGATTNAFDIIHYECTRPSGCHRIDHVSSREELDGIFVKPYVSVLLNESCRKLRSVELCWSKRYERVKIKNQYIIPVLSPSSSSSSPSLSPLTTKYDYTFNMPFGGEYGIRFNEEQQKLKEKFSPPPPPPLAPSKSNLPYSSSRYYTYSEDDYLEQLEKSSAWAQEGDFFPFVIIRRMDFILDKEKSKEVKSNEPCSYY